MLPILAIAIIGTKEDISKWVLSSIYELMHVIESDFLFPSYDVLVVGAGIGGLTAAALLAKRGLKVLVIEQHYLPGGCASIFRRKGFTFDVGASLFFGFGEEGYNPHQFVMNELEEDITLIPMEETFTIHIDDSTKVSMYTDRNRFWNELCNCFPSQSNEIKQLLREFESFYHQSIDSYGGQFFAPAETPPDHGKNLFLTRPLYLFRLLRYLLSTQGQLFRRYVKDPKFLKLFNLFNQNMTTCGLDQTPAIAGPMIHVESYTGGCYYAYGSPQVLANKLEKAIHKYDGQVLYRHQVNKILIEQGNAVGCELDNGIRINAKTVISNATIWNLYGKLIDKRHIAAKKRKWAQKFRPSYSIFGVYLGVDNCVIPVGSKPTQILPYIYEGESSYLTVYITSLLDSSSSPDGTHSLCIFLPESTPAKASPTDGKSKYHDRIYRQNKQEKAASIIDYLDKNYFHGLKDNILVQEIATPQTIERYTLKNSGAIGGPQVNMRQSYMSRLAARSDWKGLYCVGDSTSQGIGVVSVTVSAISAVNAILQDLGRDEYKPLKKYPKSHVHFTSSDESQNKNDLEKPFNRINTKVDDEDFNSCLCPRCERACPDNSHKGRIARMVEAENWIGASKAIRDLNPFSETNAYLSFSQDFCSPNCANILCPDANPPVKSLSKYICERIPNYSINLGKLINKKIAVVGAGPTGLTCAHFLARLGYEVDIFEKTNQVGGMLNWLTTSSKVPNSVLKREILNLLLPSIKVNYEKTLGDDISINELKVAYEATFLSCGLNERLRKSINMENEHKSKHGLAFLQKLNDNPDLVKDLTVFIVGSTFLADCIAEITLEQKARKVYMLQETNHNLSKYSKNRLLELENKGIKLLLNINSQELNAFYQSSDYLVCAASIDQSLEIKLVNHLADNLNVKCDSWISANAFHHVGEDNIFAGGNMVRHPGSLEEAVRDGRKAALSIHKRLRRMSIDN